MGLNKTDNRKFRFILSALLSIFQGNSYVEVKTHDQHTQSHPPYKLDEPV